MRRITIDKRSNPVNDWNTKHQRNAMSKPNNCYTSKLNLCLRLILTYFFFFNLTAVSVATKNNINLPEPENSL
jgi:hypothetical protein